MQDGKTKLGLALSGGGFRATLYHLGVLQFLHAAGMLTNITHICSVSGGSILAAHLALNWNSYTGDREDFACAASELIAFVKKDVRGRVVRRWLFSLLALLRWIPGGGWTRTHLLQNEYARLYRGKSL